jgi:hypothetical protein
VAPLPLPRDVSWDVCCFLALWYCRALRKIATVRRWRVVCCRAVRRCDVAVRCVVAQGNAKKVWLGSSETYPVLACIGLAVGWCGFMCGNFLTRSPDVQYVHALAGDDAWHGVAGGAVALQVTSACRHVAAVSSSSSTALLCSRRWSKSQRGAYVRENQNEGESWCVVIPRRCTRETECLRCRCR